MSKDSTQDTFWRAAERFWNRVAFNGPLFEGTHCWLWTHTTTSDGYGTTAVNSLPRLAHLSAYIMAFGPIKKKMQCHHRCENKQCVNPAHMKILTPKEHSDFHRQKHPGRYGKTYCKNGHEYTAENSGYHNNGCRFCRECAKESVIKFKKKKKNQEL